MPGAWAACFPGLPVLEARWQCGWREGAASVPPQSLALGRGLGAEGKAGECPAGPHSGVRAAWGRHPQILPTLAATPGTCCILKGPGVREQASTPMRLTPSGPSHPGQRQGLLWRPSVGAGEASPAVHRTGQVLSTASQPRWPLPLRTRLPTGLQGAGCGLPGPCPHGPFCPASPWAPLLLTPRSPCLWPPPAPAGGPLYRVACQEEGSVGGVGVTSPVPAHAQGLQADSGAWSPPRGTSRGRVSRGLGGCAASWTAGPGQRKRGLGPRGLP